jgi:hypothetical protein
MDPGFVTSGWANTDTLGSDPDLIQDYCEVPEPDLA